MTPDVLDFQEVTSPQLAIDAAANWTTEAARRGLILRGPCPRCQHFMEFPVAFSLFDGGVFSERSAAVASETIEVAVLCTCGYPHPGRPLGEEGCGAYWNLSIEGGA